MVNIECLSAGSLHKLTRRALDQNRPCPQLARPSQSPDNESPAPTKMAETATTPAASNGETKQQFVRPDEPDETVYKDKLYKLEKIHSESQAKFVSVASPAPVLEPHRCPSHMYCAFWLWHNKRPRPSRIGCNGPALSAAC